MAIPFNRIGTLAQNAAHLLDELHQEIMAGPSYERQLEIDQEVRLIQIICKAMLMPYADYLKRFIDLETLKNLGLI